MSTQPVVYKRRNPTRDNSRDFYMFRPGSRNHVYRARRRLCSASVHRRPRLPASSVCQPDSILICVKNQEGGKAVETWSKHARLPVPGQNSLAAKKLIPAPSTARNITLVLVPEGRGARDRLVICGTGMRCLRNPRGIWLSGNAGQPRGGTNEPALRGLSRPTCSLECAGLRHATQRLGVKRAVA